MVYLKKYIHIYINTIVVLFCLSNAYPFQDSLKSNGNGYTLNNQSIVASVGPINITAEEFYNSYEYGPAFAKRKKDSKKRYLNYMINEKLLALDGYSTGIDKKDDVESILGEFESDIATEEMFVEDILNKIEISEGEIDTVITQKQLEMDIRWLYTETRDSMNKITNALTSGISFDSLYQLQSKDSIYLDDRSMKTTRFQLGKKNPELVEMLDTLPVGKISEPIQANDGWYIFVIDNIRQNMILTESGLARLKQESTNAVKKKKMDQMSENYVNRLLVAQDPVIKRETFNVLRSYIGAYSLTQETYDGWELSEKLNEALNKLNVTNENIGQTVLVVMKEGDVSLEEFLKWYQNRSQYIKLNKNDLPAFSKSLENLIWRMIRDRLLSELAIERKFNQTENYKKQVRWWRDKVVYSTVKKEIVESVVLEENEVKLDSLNNQDEKAKDDRLNLLITQKLFHKLNELKSKYDIKINEKVLENIEVSEENNPKAIDFYTVKKGGLIPRTPYPTIDFEWINWE